MWYQGGYRVGVVGYLGTGWWGTPYRGGGYPGTVPGWVLVLGPLSGSLALSFTVFSTARTSLCRSFLAGWSSTGWIWLVWLSSVEV